MAEPQTGGRAGRASVVIALLLIALTAAKLNAFCVDLSFAYDDAYKARFGLLVCIGQAALWWLAARGFGVAGVLGAWLIQSLYLAVCWSYFAYFGLHLTLATVLSVGREGATAVGFGAIPLSLAMWWLLADLPLVIAWCWCDRTRLRWRWSLPAWALLVGSVVWLTWRTDAALTWAARERDDRYTSPTLFVRQYGLLPIQLRQMWRGQQVAQLAYGREIQVVAQTRTPRDLLLIQVESLDVGGIERAMPHLAQRAAAGVWFPRCLSYHGPGGSSDCDVAVIEGAEPLWDAVTFDQPGFCWPNSWIMRLRRAGWHAALAHGLPAAYFGFAQVMPRLGYDLWDLRELGLTQHPGEFGARDSDLVDAVLPRLHELTSPYVLHVVTMSSHAPFRQWQGWWQGADLGDDYANALAATDAQLERLIAGFLARSPQGLVVLFGDHSANLPTSDVTRSPEGQRECVPLVFLNSGLPPRRDPRLASFLDVGATVLPAVGWSGPWRSWGGDLLPVDGPLPVVRIQGAQMERISRGDGAGRGSPTSR